MLLESANVSTVSTFIYKGKVDKDVYVEKYNSLRGLLHVKRIANERKYLNFFPENIWGFLLSDTDAVEILIKIIKNSINLEKIAIVNASSYKVCICGGKLSHYIVSRQYFF
jgi:hypothetical protein